MIKQTVIAIGITALAGAAVAGQTQSEMQSKAGKGSSQSFATMDADGNGKLTWTEAQHHIPQMVFQNADTNGDTVLSKDEFKAVVGTGEPGTGDKAY